MQKFDVLVIGQGYAGLKAAKLAAERGLSTATAEKMFPGGLVMSINHLDPVPAGEEPCGPELTGGLALSNMDLGIQGIDGAVQCLERRDDGWAVTTDSGACIASNVIIASGARLRKLGVPGEAELAGMGVSECADCDGPMYQGKEAVVVGGGDSAFQEALALTAYASKITLVMRGAAPRARADLVDAVAAHPAIEVLPNTQVTEILGDRGVTGVRLRGPEGESVLDCMVVFAFVGLEPDVAFAPAEIGRDESGALMTGENLSAGLPGLWVIGAARSGFGGKLSDAAADAARVVAAL
jgi:thioredoxin reductase (NADPH)